MKKLFIVLGFLMFLFTSLSAFNIFDPRLIFTSHTVGIDSVIYFCVEKEDTTVDTLFSMDTLGNITLMADVYISDDYLVIGNSYAFKHSTTSAGLYFNSTTVGFEFLDTGGSVVFYVGLDGDVGVGGITNPTAKVDIDGEIKTDSIEVGGEEWLNLLDFGNNVFGDGKTADTVLISGATTSDRYQVTAKDSLPAGRWCIVAKAGTLFVISSAAEDDTPFEWLRYK